MKTVNVTDKIAELLISDDHRERLAYRADTFPKDQVLQQRSSSEKVYTDAFDGELYANFVENNLFENKYDVALTLSIDGFHSKVSSTKLVMVHCVILNYDISEVNIFFFFFFCSRLTYLLFLLKRFSREFTFQFAIIFGKSKINLNSYLKPIVCELSSLSHTPLLFKKTAFKLL